jgi:hypothetical protein
MASYWLREFIENSSCDSYGELVITWFEGKKSCVFCGELVITWLHRKLVMCLVWRVNDYLIWSKTRHVVDMASSIDYVIWSKTSHVLAVASYPLHDLIEIRHVVDMANYWLRALIEISSCGWYGELLITCVDRKLVLWLILWVIDNDDWSKTSHVFVCGEFFITWFDRKLVMWLICRVIDYVSSSKTRHVIYMVSYRKWRLIKN